MDAVRSLEDAAQAAQREGNANDLERIARKLVALCEATCDRARLALGHRYLASAYFWRNDGRNAEAAYARALEIYTELGDEAGLAHVRIGLAALAVDVELDVKKGYRLYHESLPSIRALGDQRALAVALGNLAEVCCLEGEYASAIRYAGEAGALLVKLERWAQAGGQYATIAHAAALQRDFPAALENMNRAWSYLQREPNARSRASYFEIWFVIASAMRRYEIAAQLYGFLERYRDEHHARRLSGILPWLSEPVEQLGKRLGSDRAHELALAGQALTLERAQALAGTLGG